MTPFTYYLYHPETKMHYYGVRYKRGCEVSDIWTTYFTSSKKVKALIEVYGKDSFEVEVRKTFDSVSAARRWETKVLRRLKVEKKKHWLNITSKEAPHCVPGLIPTKEHREKVAASKRGKKRVFNDKWRENMAAARRGKKKSSEHKEKIAAAKTGLKASEEHKAAIRAGLARRRLMLSAINNHSGQTAGSSASRPSE